MSEIVKNFSKNKQFYFVWRFTLNPSALPPILFFLHILACQNLFNIRIPQQKAPNISRVLKTFSPSPVSFLTILTRMFGRQIKTFRFI